MEEISKVISDQGLAVAALIFVMYLFYKFFNVKLEIMKKQLEKELTDKKYVAKGQIHNPENSVNFELELEVKQVTE